jgi:hypothetical protein
MRRSWAEWFSVSMKGANSSLLALLSS